jgi:hypothetical protein
VPNPPSKSDVDDAPVSKLFSNVDLIERYAGLDLLNNLLPSPLVLLVSPFQRLPSIAMDITVLQVIMNHITASMRALDSTCMNAIWTTQHVPFLHILKDEQHTRQY